MLNDLDALALWATRSYTTARGDTPSLVLVVVGGDYDALSTPTDLRVHDTDIEQLGWMIGYIGFPCDAIYVACTWEDTDVHTWAHCIPTNESTLLNADGFDRHTAEEPAYHPLQHAAHAFDQFRPEREGRQKAMALALTDHESLHDTIWYEPGTILPVARQVRV